MQRTHLSLYHILIVVLIALTLSACKGEDAAATPEPEPVQPTAAPTVPPAATEIPQASEITWNEYASANGALYIKYPSGWVINEVPTVTGYAFAIAPSREYIEKKPDFGEPVVFAFGTINQVSRELAQPANLPSLHQQAFSPSTGFTFVLKGEPTVTTPSPYVTYFLTEAASAEANGVTVHWMLGTALADLTVAHFGVGVSEAGFAEYSQLALEMFNSLEVDTVVTGKLAGQ